ncbi:MAG: M20/M25/M40 family metallo-hydrolase [Ignavibacteriaceae bacterium]|nr:M20/M25/M40 family metallo-hydrolase [Ignavibacteriaceae bacterium]
MKFSAYLLFLFIVCFSKIIAQETESYLISVPVKDDFTNNKIESLKLPVIYMNDDQLLTLITSEKLDELEALGVKYFKLDQCTSEDKFYIITSKKDLDVSSRLVSEQIVYNGINSVIVKNTTLNPAEASLKGLMIVELNGSINYKNEKGIWNFDRLQFSDSLITQITSSVNPDSVRYFIQSLQNFQTRFLLANTRDAVAEWLKNQFISMGFAEVVIDSFQYQGTWQKNVVATLPGIYEPQVFNIVGGHHDSYSSGDPMIFAPGADDNASGTAAVLEIARVIKANNYQPESTIKFITFAAEEYGLWGSVDYAQKAFNSGMNIKIMINHDMISHSYYPANQSEVDINRYTGFDYLRDLAFYCIENYSTLAPRNGSLNSAGSDSHSFWERGFPSVYFEETNFSPYYHSPADTIGNYNIEYCAEVIKSSCATLLLNIVMPSAVQNYNLVDAGTGSSLLLTWSPNPSPDFHSYKIYIGDQSGVYDTVLTTTDTIFTVGGLIEGNLYYVGVSVLDQDGFESLIVERSAVPFEFPFAPEGFTANPLWQQVELLWFSNTEYDLQGYNLYRSAIEGQLGTKLNQNILQDTSYVDAAAGNGIYYYYTVKAVDSLLNESLNNTTIRSRVVSLDQGILIVDETADGDGSLMNPTDAEVDDFYNDLLIHFNKQQYDMIEESQIGLADLGAFSTVVWHGNDITDMDAPYDYKDEIKKYLDFGGNFLYTGYRPAKAFEKIVGLNGTFSTGHFIFDYLKIQETKSTVFALFNEAISKESGYSNIFVDSMKTLSSNDYHLKNIEMIKPSAEGTEVFSFGANYDSTSQQGFLKGKPVGIEYIGNDIKTITLSFPLYYMNKEQARSLMQYILTTKFAEVMPVEDNTDEIPSEYQLYQNYPNPFNPSTTIKYSIPEEGFVKLAVYNMIGEEVSTLVKNVQKAGKYEVNFNASGLSSGVYVYRIEAANYTASKKLMLMK